MWAQEWTNLYPLVEPYPGVSSLDVTRRARGAAVGTPADGEARRELLHRAGLDPLPAPSGRGRCYRSRGPEVVCHASAWDVTYSGDLRIKMCIRPEEEHLITIHHELGHNYYQHAYVKHRSST
jgi:peptidyl-dipeptidase A